jgi:hypothetical protein
MLQPDLNIEIIFRHIQSCETVPFNQYRVHIFIQESEKKFATFTDFLVFAPASGKIHPTYINRTNAAVSFYYSVREGMVYYT